MPKQIIDVPTSLPINLHGLVVGSTDKEGKNRVADGVWLPQGYSLWLNFYVMDGTLGLNTPEDSFRCRWLMVHNHELMDSNDVTVKPPWSGFYHVAQFEAPTEATGSYAAILSVDTENDIVETDDHIMFSNLAGFTYNVVKFT